MTGLENRHSVCSVFLTLLLSILLLSGCGNATDTSGLSGTWVLSAASDGTVTMPDGLMSEIPVQLRLDPDGTGIISNGSSDGRVKWNYQQGMISLYAGQVKLTGYADGGEIILTEADTETVLHFIPMSVADAVTKPDPELFGVFLGDWYGWWKVESSDGEMPASWYDSCATISLEDDGSVRLIMWDEDSSRTEPLADVSLTPQSDGTLLSCNGYFLFDEIVEGEWILFPNDDAVYLTKQLHDAEGEVFYYSFYLRRWGKSWNGMLEEQRPFYYDDWYLPLIKQKAAMPDSIPWEKLEDARVNP